MSESLTEEERLIIDRMMIAYSDEINKRFDDQMREEMAILSKYKGELVQAYREVSGQREMLIGCVGEIIDRQEQLQSLMRDLIKAFTGEFPKVLAVK